MGGKLHLHNVNFPCSPPILESNSASTAISPVALPVYTMTNSHRNPSRFCNRVGLSTPVPPSPIVIIKTLSTWCLPARGRMTRYPCELRAA